MARQDRADPEKVRAAELVSSLCLATDLGMGFPLEHGLRATALTMRICETLGLDAETASQTYYACLLMYAGCTTDADISAKMFRGGLTEKHLTDSLDRPPRAL